MYPKTISYKIGLLFLSLLLVSFALPTTPSAEVTVGLELVVDGGLTHPIALVSPPDGTKRRFIVEQVGRIRVLLPDGKILPDPFLDIREKIVPLVPDFDERGLLGLAFHPDFKTNGRFFVHYSAPKREDAPLRVKFHYNHTARIAEFRVSPYNPNRADPLSERTLLVIDQPQFNHNGGAMAFGPDGYLYISIGDGGFANDWGIGHDIVKGNGQDTSTLLGKILRIDVDKGEPYGIPPDNPFVGREGYLPEIFAYGFRNTWQMSFDAGGDHALFGADVGQNLWEEVNIITKGGNYGWNKKEGTHCFDPFNPNTSPAQCPDTVDGIPLIGPIIEYPSFKTNPAEGKGISVTGGYVYRGKAMPELNGYYIFGDWSKQFFGGGDGSLFLGKPPAQAGGMWSMEEIKIAGRPNGRLGAYLLAFGQDADNELYILTAENTGPVGIRDRVYKLVPAPR